MRTGVRGAIFFLQAGQAEFLIAAEPFANGVASSLKKVGGGADPMLEGMMHQMKAEIEGVVFGTCHGKVRYGAHAIPSLELLVKTRKDRCALFCFCEPVQNPYSPRSQCWRRSSSWRERSPQGLSGSPTRSQCSRGGRCCKGGSST